MAYEDLRPHRDRGSIGERDVGLIDGFNHALRNLASGYAWHPDYRDEFEPTGIEAHIIHVLKDGAVTSTATGKETATQRGDYPRGHTVNERVKHWFNPAGLSSNGGPVSAQGMRASGATDLADRGQQRGPEGSGPVGEGLAHPTARVRTAREESRARPVRQRTNVRSVHHRCTGRHTRQPGDRHTALPVHRRPA
ncbi:hypothetical protein [Streptomyces sp. NBC_00212]|uniref:hypothetical protein n=1 Tax=Streptomyces sp. NBC_00212 TaxID=2975684 RepID=UPI00324C7806